MRAVILVYVLVLAVWPISGTADDACADGTLWEPYTMVCAEVRDVRDQFLSADPETADSLPLLSEDLPVPGGLSVGTVYEQLQALTSGRLHTKMFVYPDGLQPDGDLPPTAGPLGTVPSPTNSGGLVLAFPDLGLSFLCRGLDNDIADLAWRDTGSFITCFHSFEPLIEC